MNESGGRDDGGVFAGDVNEQDVNEQHVHEQPEVPSAFASGFRNFHAGCCGFVATRPDGSEWPFMVTLHDGSTMHGQSAGVLLAEMIPGYAAASGEQDRLRLRTQDALAQAVRAQRQEVDRARQDGAVDPADPADAPLLALLDLPKGEALRLAVDDPEGPAPEDGSEAPRQAPWWGAVPLVLVTTTYAPHTDAPRIGGNTRWLDPSDEVAYLRSLRDVGLYDVWMESA